MLVLVVFLVSLLISLSSSLDNSCVKKKKGKHLFCHRRLILHLLLQNSNPIALNQADQRKDMETNENSIAFSLTLPFLLQNLIVPAAFDYVHFLPT